MGGKGGSGPSNNQMVQLEMQRAQEARDKENERQARLNQGKTAIDSIFGNDNFGDAFYEKYRKAGLDYTLPQLQKQYGEAKRTSEADLARAGLLRSGAAGFVQNKLTEQQGVNEAALRAKADTDTAELRKIDRRATAASLQPAVRHRRSDRRRQHRGDLGRQCAVAAAEPGRIGRHVQADRHRLGLRGRAGGR